MLKQIFTELTSDYIAPEQAIRYWEEIEQGYSGSNRHYHTLGHLEALATQLSAVRPLAGNWEALLFAMFYHDIVYNVLKHDNEEKSAALAVKRMREIGFAEASAVKCSEHILATKRHETNPAPDTNLFTDADLSILGSDPDTYAAYVQNVRKEYSIYPDLVYKPGRKKVLKHFLDMPRIYKTAAFADKYEQQARVNMALELERM